MQKAVVVFFYVGVLLGEKVLGERTCLTLHEVTKTQQPFEGFI